MLNMPRIIDYVQDLRRHGEGYYLKDMDDDFIIVANKKRVMDSFIFMRASAFADLMIKNSLHSLAVDIRKTLQAIDERARNSYRKK
jgi:hypothetical protein